MKKVLSSVVTAVALLSAMACSRGEATLTTAGGSARIAGNVILTDSVAQNSREGIEVRAVGSGVVGRTDVNGSFELFGVDASDVTLSFTRATDGINATLANVSPTESLQIALNASSAKRRGRGIGHPGRELEGLLKSIASGSLVVTTPSGDVTVKTDDKTVVRKGKSTLALSDLSVGTRVHIKATVSATDNSLTAVEIRVQNADGSEDDGDDDANVMTVNGKVTATGANQLTVLTANGTTKTVKVDANTTIKRKGDTLLFSDLKVDDQVEALGTKIDDTTILAKKIEAQSGEKPRK